MTPANDRDTQKCDHYFGPWHFRPHKNFKGSRQYWYRECSKCQWQEEVYEKPLQADPRKQYQVRWSYTSKTEPTFGRYCATLDRVLEEVAEAKRMGMLYIDIVHPDGKVEIRKGYS